MAVHILGIRHHGPGSARGVRTFLETVKPDIVLVEGPPEADGILAWVGHEALKPPVAILCYQPDNPQRSVFYPFAEFSPEWQAILYARMNKIHVRFMDLPVSNQFAIEVAESTKPAAPEEVDGTAVVAGVSEQEGADGIAVLAAVSEQKEADGTKAASECGEADGSTKPAGSAGVGGEEAAGAEGNAQSEAFPINPTAWLARAAGFADEEKWWEHMFEHRQDTEPVFDAVTEAMAALREDFPEKTSRLEQTREAHMRKSIRQAEKEMFQNIAVICGAWHAPALTKMPPVKEDNELLKGLPKIKTECTWIPWTFERLSFRSGYGAGIVSPGWYDHIWNHPQDDGIRWMAKVAAAFREKQMDISVAHVMEAVRLAHSLSSMRHLSRCGLEELNEASLSVLCHGETILMELIREKLIVSDRIGSTPDEIPKPPLQLDIERLQKRLRLPATAEWKDYTLDLRKEGDLERSIFLHRLLILNIGWGSRTDTSGKGTFKELWRLQWNPSFSIEIIEKGSYGNTIAEAAEKFAIEKAGDSTSLQAVTALLSETLPAELKGATDTLIERINNLAAASADVIQLMEALPELVSISRYGNVRKTDADMVLEIVDSMATRICISLPAASTAIDQEAASHQAALYASMDEAVQLLQDESLSAQWEQTLNSIAANANTSPLLAGYATRLLADRKLLAGDALVRAFHYAMSSATAPSMAAAWIEGFLKGSGSFLVVDNALWSVVYDWVASLNKENFTDVLPLLRRSFTHFTQPERRRLGEKVKHGGGQSPSTAVAAAFDPERARTGIPVIFQLLGIKPANIDQP